MRKRMEKTLHSAVAHGLHSLKTEVESRLRRDLRLPA
jgi:hypothetical protein